ncbi:MULTISPECIES: hypothetical protein [Agrobacterium]|uniref:Leucine-rich repeat domain-containing protein n=1 Tax=Agrobacterium tumefaciens TaxID=358 RepID=A0AAE6B914_AGRTU|nr:MULTISPECIES: hypothetical protein [Agrobacterium]QCL72540.1 hypothetical protein CFBP5499_03250 [Agrobacterium tumefaciens]QCL78112.1 hypothetical protein CFBP5877_02800 [Agrobacterium tumefaciens]
MVYLENILRELDELRKENETVFHSRREIDKAPAGHQLRWCLQNIKSATFTEIPASDHVTHLYLLELNKLHDLKGIERFRELRSLWLYGCDALETIDGIQELDFLETLTIWPSFSSTITLDTIAPVSGSTSLKEFIFSGKSRDGRLEPFFKLEKMERVFLSNSFNWEEFARLEANQPNMGFPWKGGIVYDANPSVLRCSTCETNLAMLTGKGMKPCCPVCDRNRIAKHLARYSEVAKLSKRSPTFGG